MSLFRSAEMKCFEVFFPKEQSYEVVQELAKHGFAQVMGQGEPHGAYGESVKRCSELVAKIDRIMGLARQRQMSIPRAPNVEEVLSKHLGILAQKKLTSLQFLDSLEEEVESVTRSIHQMSSSLIQLSLKVQELRDYRELLFRMGETFGSDAQNAFSEEDMTAVVHPKNTQQFSKNKSYQNKVQLNPANLQLLRLSTVSGVIAAKQALKFQRMVFRATKGHCVLYAFEVQRETGEEVRCCFILVCEGGRNVLAKIKRICQSFNAKTYAISSNKEEIFTAVRAVENEITESQKVAKMTERSLGQALQHVLQKKEWGCARWEALRILFQRELKLFSAMNCLRQFRDASKSTASARLWVPSNSQPQLYRQLPQCVTIRECETRGTPPTHIEVNSFTAPFQQLINTYGVPRYQEVNPGLFAVPIFSFLFGVMFGDIGHGGCFLAFALLLTQWPPIARALPQLYAIRYMLLLMGFFAFFSGWIYNEFFSIPINLFGSCYSPPEAGTYSIREEGCVYPFGFDPRWIRASNDLNFFNSYKMKFAVIVGVLQMSLGKDNGLSYSLKNGQHPLLWKLH